MKGRDDSAGVGAGTAAVHVSVSHGGGGRSCPPGVAARRWGATMAALGQAPLKCPSTGMCFLCGASGAQQG